MGANASKATHATSAHHTHQKIQDLVDLGSVLPNGLYPTALQDYDLRVVRNLILARKLAPFYKGLADPPEPVAEPMAEPMADQSARLPVPQVSTSMSTVSSTLSVKHTQTTRPRSASSSQHNREPPVPHLRQMSDRELALARMRHRERTLYNNAVECPVCFLYYPAHINFSRCCDQPICTECFVQIKRPIDSPSTPASCPFCMQENFGVVYKPPAWSDNAKTRDAADNDKVTQSGTTHTTSGVSNTTRPRRKTISHDDPSVVLIDHVRPNWNRMLTVQARTPSSRRNSASTPSRGPAVLRTVATAPGMYYITRRDRSASSAAPSEYAHYMRDIDMDLEEWMVAEAIRRSLAEQEQQNQEPQATPIVSQDPSLPTINITERSADDDDDDNQPLATSVRLHGLQQQQPTSTTSLVDSSVPSPPASTAPHNSFAEPVIPANPDPALNPPEDDRNPEPKDHKTSSSSSTTTTSVAC